MINNEFSYNLALFWTWDILKHRIVVALPNALVLGSDKLISWNDLLEEVAQCDFPSGSVPPDMVRKFFQKHYGQLLLFMAEKPTAKS
ncbi:hypothetical protein Tco_1325400 [Tanacetum coccineum]